MDPTLFVKNWYWNKENCPSRSKRLGGAKDREVVPASAKNQLVQFENWLIVIKYDQSVKGSNFSLHMFHSIEYPGVKTSYISHKQKPARGVIAITFRITAGLACKSRNQNVAHIFPLCDLSGFTCWSCNHVFPWSDIPEFRKTTIYSQTTFDSYFRLFTFTNLQEVMNVGLKNFPSQGRIYFHVGSATKLELW